MVNNDIKKKYKTKIKEFKKHIELYYDKSKPVITDSEFDRLKQEILEIEKNFPSLASKKSISTSVGYKPSKSFEKYKHKIPMLSLSNAFNSDDLKNFEKKIVNFLNDKPKFQYSVEPKID